MQLLPPILQNNVLYKTETTFTAFIESKKSVRIAYFKVKSRLETEGL